HDPCDEDDREAAVDRVKTRKKLASVGLEGFQRSHAGQDHRRVGEGIDPAHVFEPVVPEHADGKRHRYYQRAGGEAAHDPPHKETSGDQRLAVALVHGANSSTAAICALPASSQSSLPPTAARMASKENPRDCRKRICLARSSRVLGATRNFLSQTSRARSTSVARAALAVCSASPLSSPLARDSCTMRAAPYFRESAWAGAFA